MAFCLLLIRDRVSLLEVVLSMQMLSLCLVYSGSEGFIFFRCELSLPHIQSLNHFLGYFDQLAFLLIVSMAILVG